MPKTEIDYSNTIIYKITCKDPIVTDVYVGHTTNFVQRKHAHKQSCINDKTPNYKCKLYEVIRNNGGWINWKMEIINFFECHDHYEARKKEQEYFISLNATLNSIEPMPKPKPKEIVIKPPVIKEIFFCEKCNIHCSNLNLFKKHNETKKHLKNLTKNYHTEVELIISEKISPKFFCEKCDFKCSRTQDWERHLTTSKHKNTTEYNNDVKKYSCECGKSYNHRASLFNHSKNCSKLNYNTTIASDASNNDIIQLLIKENTDFKTMLMDMMKNTTDLVKNNTDLQKQMLEMCKNNNNSNTTINEKEMI